MSLLLRCARLASNGAVLSKSLTRPFSSSSPTTSSGYRSLLYAVVGFGAIASAAVSKSVHLDSAQGSPFVADPATSIEFPKTITVPAKAKIPPLSLVGVGVRTVSFVGLKVYSVGFYADLNNPKLKISADLSPDEKVREIINNTACVVRIVPTRATSYIHLRDAFMRALQSRLAIAKKAGTITEKEEQAAASPMRKLKSIFPNSPLGKHVPLDMYLSAPVPEQLRTLSFRDLGAIQSDWVATELVLHYFEGDGPSPPLKKSVLGYLKDFTK